MSSIDLLESYFEFRTFNSGTDVIEPDIELEGSNLLAFLATAQEFQIQFLPLAWDVARGVIGIGGTSRIHQALVDIDTSFAFKTFHKRNIPEERVFRSLTTEITVLSQPFVREHPNISQLQGICWDISPDDDKPWPVLVFEKSHLGDLYHFARHDGKDMSLEERLSLCSDIGSAIMDMHANRIVHGDIKPENVLIFRDNSGKYSARVIDFGYSTRYAHDKQQLKLPRSKPWNAPENEGNMRTWTPGEASQSDLFCLGMVYLWLLFEPFLRVMERSGQEERTEALLNRIKQELPKFVSKFLEMASFPNHGLEAILLRLFQSVLAYDPHMRDTERVEEFLEALNSKVTRKTRRVWTNVEESIESSRFEIQKSVWHLYATDYRVRYHVAQQVYNQSSTSVSIALQAALCYYIGFGVRKDVNRAKELLERTGLKIEAIKNIIDSDIIYEVFKTTTVSRLFDGGVLLQPGFAHTYLEQGRLNKAEETLTQERIDLESIYGTNHDLTIMVSVELASLFDLQGRAGDAEKLKLQVLNACKTKLGEDHPSTLTSMANLASTYRSQGRWDEAENLEMQVMEVNKERLGEDHPDTLTSMNNLVSTFIMQGLWEEAEKLQVPVVNAYKTKLGEDHPSTLTSIANLAFNYSNQGRWEEAEKLELQVMETSEAKLGEDYYDILISMGNLAATYGEQGRWEEAEKLQVQVIDTYKRKRGEDHPSTLTSMANLALDYRDQGRWEEAEKLEL